MIRDKFIQILISTRKSAPPFLSLCSTSFAFFLVEKFEEPFHNLEIINGNTYQKEYAEVDLNIADEIIFYSQSFKCLS